MTSSDNDSSTSSLAVIIDKKAFQCSICYNDFGDGPYVLRCGHSFCRRCIQNIKNEAIQRHENVFKCPMCSSTQDVNSEVKKNYSFWFIHDHVKSTKDFILQSQEYKSLQERVINNDNNRLKEQAERITAEIISVQEDRILQLESHIEAQGEVLNYETLSSSTRVKVNAAEKTIQKLKEDAIIEKNKAAESQKALKEEIQKLQADVVFEKNRLTELRKVINRKEQENAIFSTKLEVLGRENGKLKADIKNKEATISGLRETINRKEQENATICAKLEALGRENGKLKADIKNKEATISGLRETINRENKKAVCALKTLEQEKQKYINDIAREKNEILERQKVFDLQKEQYMRAREDEKNEARIILYIRIVVIACFVAYFLYRL